jgi:hypothetical protein
MVTSISLSTMTLASFNSKYRFGFVDKTDDAPIETSTYQPNSQESSRYHTLTLDEFNKDMLDLEAKTNKTAVVLGINDQPREIVELLSKVASGKYGNFVRKNLDNVVLGRNFQKKNASGNFVEDLGATANKEISQAIEPTSQAKLGFIDTYNSAFNSVTTKTSGDKAFTRFSQVVSVYMNELKQAYYQSKGQMKEDADVYTFVKEALTATKDYMDKGGSLSFVKSSEKTIFGTAIQMMSDNVDSYLKTLGSTGHTTISFTGLA